MFERIDLQLFADGDPGALALNTNVTTQTADATTGLGGMTVEMKEYYDTELLENARRDLYFAQFGRKQPLPKGKGNTVEWRRWNTFEKPMTPLTEGVNPDGQKFGATNITTACSQHGTFTAISDKLELQAVDDIILGATEEMGATAGETMDTLIRNKIVNGNQIQYAPTISGSTETAVSDVSGIDATAILTPKLVNKVATQLKKAKTPRINGDYIAIIHPSCSYDLRQSTEWVEAHKYASPEEIYNGEIGRLHGVRFIEDDNVLVTKDGDDGCAVYHNLFFGQDAYGIVDPEGAGLEMIVHDKSSGGTSNPLNLYSTIGCKLMYGASVVYPERLVEVVCGSEFSDTDEANDDGLAESATGSDAGSGSDSGSGSDAGSGTDSGTTGG